VIAMTTGGKASQLDEFHWKNRVLVVVAPAGAPAAETQRRIYESSARGMSERAIMLTDRERQRVQVFLVGKDGHTAISSDKPLSAEYLFARVDAMPMRQDEMRRAR
jgi:Domain of unknown function (DUF4174)